MTKKIYYARTTEGEDPSKRQSLKEHSVNVGELTGGFAEPFSAGKWGLVLGIIHDLGKTSPAFQNYLLEMSNYRKQGPDHATAGGRWLVNESPILGHLLAFAAMGHHGGLQDAMNDSKANLEYRLWDKSIPPYDEKYPGSLCCVEKFDLESTMPEFLKGILDPFTFQLLVRMLFSCVIDADRLDAERFVNPDKAALRGKWEPDILNKMEIELHGHINKFGPPKTHINQLREMIWHECLNAAELSPGFFSLTVPTGGGKTLSSLGFALHHAVKYGLERIFYIVPFTTITSQTANTFRQVFESLGFNIVIEHHSAVSTRAQTIEMRLATENWDGILTITTSVQFYESLFARGSGARKIHNLTKSVIILDEAQELPVEYLKPCLRVLTELKNNYGTTIVFCTATQPGISRTFGFPIGLDGIREIISDKKQLFKGFSNRVEMKILGWKKGSRLSKITKDIELVELLSKEYQVLCIVNLKKQARLLFKSLPKNPGHFHLSTNMCSRHRNQILEEILFRLKNGLLCRVVSTSLIEAGVDIDFSCVYRSLAGVPSINQAAGRCNRHGKLDKGRVYVFLSEHSNSEQYLNTAVNATQEVLALIGNLTSLEANEKYFERYYRDQSHRWDEHGVCGSFKMSQNEKLPYIFLFEEVDKNFNIIKSRGLPVVIPWDKEGEDLCEELRYIGDKPEKSLLSKLRPYIVDISKNVLEKHIVSNKIEKIERTNDIYYILRSVKDSYSNLIGFELE